MTDSKHYSSGILLQFGNKKYQLQDQHHSQYTKSQGNVENDSLELRCTLKVQARDLDGSTYDQKIATNNEESPVL
jgi:hypothetical protein